jgi:oligo-1,6-glucosidase
MISKVYPLRDDKNPLRFQKGTPFYVDGPRMHEFLQELNDKALSLYDTYTVGESYIPDEEHAHRYINEESGELDTIFDFEHLTSDNAFGLKMIPKPFNLRQFKRGLIDPQLKYHGSGWNTLVLENHDQARSVSRFGINTKKYRYEAATFLAMITFLGWGTPFIYQGEEIGMTNTKFKSRKEMKDPVTHFIFEMTEELHIPERLAFRMMRGAARDNARTPMQWDSSYNAGFNMGAKPWQCVSGAYRDINVRRDLESERSVYRFYQELFAFRRESEVALHGETHLHLPKNRKMVVYSRELEGRRLLIVGNFSNRSRRLGLPFGFEAKRLRVRLSNYDKQLPRREMTLRPYEAIVFEEV